jgi:hypothetical protein
MRAASAAARRLERVRTLWVVAALAPLQWLIALLVAMHAPHNGWLFYTGGDATQYWSHEWALAHGMLPLTVLGYAVPVFFAWVPRLFGPTQLTGAAPIMFVQVLVLGTVALVCVHALATRLAGRVFALWATTLWVVVPVAAIPLWREDFHERYSGLFLPQALGIVNLGDYPSMVVLLAAAVFAFRTIDTGRGNDAVLTGLLCGLAVGVKPSNALILGSPVLAFAVARRWREIVLYGVALLPALLTLALWKQRGLGHVPLLTLPETRQAMGVPLLPRVGDYLDFDRARFAANMAQIREFFWSRLLLEYLGVAGAVAALRRAPAKGIYLVTWLAAIVIVKGGSPVADVRTTSFFRLTMPGFPAFFLLAATAVLLVPGWGRFVRAPRVNGTPPRRTRGLIVALVVLVALPLAAVAAAQPAPRERLARNLNTLIETPISTSLAIRPERIPDGVRLRWAVPPRSETKVFYVVYRTTTGDGCSYDEARAVQECVLGMTSIGQTEIRFLEDTPPPGTYTYRVGISASWKNDAQNGDLILLSPPTTVAIRCTTEKCRRDIAKLKKEGKIA